MKRKGFTLIELLVVISIIALLMAILMPALARVKQIAYRVVCGHNLKGVGIANAVYAHDDDTGRYPRAGGRGSILATDATGGQNLDAWDAPTETGAFGALQANYATLTSCFWLLIKGGYTNPAQFVCKSDTQVNEFKLWVEGDPGPHTPGNNNADYGDVWDFGANETYMHCSYSYQMPFLRHAASSSSLAGIAIAADRNPFINSQDAVAAEIVDADVADTDITPAQFFWDDDDLEGRRNGNSTNHQQDGQNVLFNDGHVAFEKLSYCAVDEDNVYTQWNMLIIDNPQMRKRNGISPSMNSRFRPNIIAFSPAHREDSILLNEEFPQPEI